MSGKRPHEANGEDSDAKRLRSNHGSPVASPNNAQSEQEAREVKNAATAKRIAALKAKIANRHAAPPPAPPPSQTPSQAPPPSPTPGATPPTKGEIDADKKARILADIQAKKMEFAKRHSAPSPTNGAAATPPATIPSGKPTPNTRAQMIAEAKARAAAIAAGKKGTPPVTASAVAPPPPPPTVQDNQLGRGGLSIGLHPLLMNDSAAKADGKIDGQFGPKFSTTKGNQQPPKPKVNPYLAADADAKTDDRTSYDPRIAAPPKERKSRAFEFNKKGKWIAAADRLREQAELEEMKRRIAAENRKTQIEEASDRAFLLASQTALEWWDEGILAAGNVDYQDWQKPERNKIGSSDSIVTRYVQHPVVLEAPQDKFIPAPKPLPLTAKEQAKMRRQRRMMDMKEEQAKIRLGLVAAPAPKVKKSNMMRVLGEQAVKDPTAVEARVNREIAARRQTHEQANLDRKLTTEERHEKLQKQQTGDEAKGIKIAVFKVNDLSSGKHRYQVDINAKQNALTGIVILNPEYNLVIVEGGTHSIDNYKKLMLQRIKWDENVSPLYASKPSTTFTGAADGSVVDESTGERGQGSKAAEWCNPYDADGELKDLSNNKCVLLWEGDESTRVFKKWGSKACETDGQARDALTRQKMENMWSLAKGR